MNDALRKKLKSLAIEHRQELIKIILEEGIWPEDLETKISYVRQSDDNKSQIGVTISGDGDSWIEIFAQLDPHEFSFYHRFRNYVGGGQSLRTHTALRILALAIKLDGDERRQPLLPFGGPGDHI